MNGRKKYTHLVKAVYYSLYGLIIIFLFFISITALIIFLDSPPQYDADIYFIQEGDQYKTAHSCMTRESFSAIKDSNTFRIFILGGSEAQGSPYINSNTNDRNYWLSWILGLPEGGGIVTWVEEYFQNLYPHKKVEMINAAVTSHDIQTATEVYKEIIRIGRADLVIVLSGNNERDWEIIGQDGVLEKDHDLIAYVNDLATRYEQNINEISDLANSNQILTYFLTVPSNLRDWYPARNEENFDVNYYENKIGKEAAFEVINELKNKGNSSADYYYVMGKAYEEAGIYDTAYLFFLAARDNDRAFLRTRSIYNNIIRNMKVSSFVRTLDIEEKLRNYSKDSIPGYDLFVDYCHTNLIGNALIAKEIAGFYKNDHQIKQPLVLDTDLKDYYKERLKSLKLVKKIKWLRMKYFASLSGLGADNIESIRKNYSSSSI